MKSFEAVSRAQRNRDRQHHREAGINGAGDEIRRENRRVPAGNDGHREVEAHDGVDRKHQRRRQARQQQIRRLVAVPVARRTAPAHRQHAVNISVVRLADRAIAQRRQVGNQADEPEQQRNRAVGRNREHVPDQRAAELRPDPHRARDTGTCNTPSTDARCGSAGTMPAQATANSVIASAKRLIEVRHFWFSKNKIAEISVPAWPIPIHQTKLTIAKPQPTGMLMPQMPTPLMISQATATVRTINNVKTPGVNPANQPSDIGCVRRSTPILSVTDCVGMPRRKHRRQSADLWTN